jgi:hypothetical protein
VNEPSRRSVRGKVRSRIGKERSAQRPGRSAIQENKKGTGIACIADAENPRAFDDGPKVPSWKAARDLIANRMLPLTEHVRMT